MLQQRAPLLMVIAFFVLTGVSPQGLNVDLASRLVNARLDLSLQHIGLVIALGLFLRWRWARVCGRFVSWGLLSVIAIELSTTSVGVFSGPQSFHFSVLWSRLGGASPLVFLLVGTLFASYLYWQSRMLASSEIKALFDSATTKY